MSRDWETPALFVSDLSGRCVDVDEAGCRLLGLERDAVVGSRLADLLVLEGDERPLELSQLPVGGSIRLRRKVRRGDGAPLNLDVLFRRITPDLIAALASHVEIEERAERFSQALRAARAGAWEWNIRTGDVRWSDENFLVLGRRPGEMSASYDEWLKAVHPDDREGAEAAVARASRDRSDLDIEFRVVWPDGTVRWIRDVGKMVFDDAGEPRAMFGIQIDTTDRKEAELARERAEQHAQLASRMEAVGRLAGGVAHDFNNLLTVILSAAHMAARNCNDPEVVRSDVVQIEEAASQAAALTRQLLTFSSHRPITPSALDLNARVRALEPILRRVLADDQQLRIELDGSLGAIEADAGEIDQALLNLGLNARDAMPSGGVVLFTTMARELPASSGEADALPPGTYAELTVSDTGVGMDPLTASRAFEPFFTTKEPGHGTGLGLASVYGIVTKAGGRVSVESAPGHGAHFRLLFRASSRKPAFRDSPPTAPRPAVRATILLVDDEPAVRRLARRVLEADGHAVIDAADGESALKALDELDRPPDLLVTDVVMPDLSGPELAQAIVARCPTVRVLYISGYSGDALHAHGVDMRTATLLEKPFSRGDLVEAVQRVLAERPAREV